MNLVELARADAEEAHVTTTRHVISVKSAAAEVIGIWDWRRIAQVLANLLSNAIKYSPEGGRVEVSVAARGDEAVVSVRDEGIGIPASSIGSLFDRYYRAPGASRSKAEGMGLGLYVAYGIIASHKGRLWVESEDEKGSCFSFALPLAGPLALCGTDRPPERAERTLPA